jgi:hypothetical protein
MYLESRSAIKVKDFDNELYIAVHGVPLLPIPRDWTALQILERLSELRDGYSKNTLKNNQSYMSLKDYVNRNQSKTDQTS